MRGDDNGLNLARRSVLSAVVDSRTRSRLMLQYFRRIKRGGTVRHSMEGRTFWRVILDLGCTSACRGDSCHSRSLLCAELLKYFGPVQTD